MKTEMVAAALAGLVLGVPAGGQSDLRLAREEYPVVDGSTSTQPLGVLVAGRVTRTSVEWRRASFFDPTRRLLFATLVLAGRRAGLVLIQAHH
jgi:hypothetical protein